MALDDLHRNRIRVAYLLCTVAVLGSDRTSESRLAGCATGGFWLLSIVHALFEIESGIRDGGPGTGADARFFAAGDAR